MSESETIVNRPLGKIGGPLFCICLFITCFYGAVFLVGPALSLIYIWVCIHRVDSAKFKTPWNSSYPYDYFSHGFIDA